MNTEHAAQFERLLAEITAIQHPDQNDEAAGEFLFDDDLYARIRLVEPGLMIEVYLLDAAHITGPARTLMTQAVLLCNRIGTAGRPFIVGLNDIDQVLLHHSLPLEALTAGTVLENLAYLVEQARSIRGLLNLLALGAWPHAENAPDTTTRDDNIRP